MKLRHVTYDDKSNCAISFIARVNQSQALSGNNPSYSIGCHYVEAFILFHCQCDRIGVRFKVLFIGMLDNVYETYIEGTTDLIYKNYLINVFSINGS